MASLSESENVQLVVNAHDDVLACIIYLDFAGLCYPIRTYFSQISQDPRNQTNPYQCEPDTETQL